MILEEQNGKKVYSDGELTEAEMLRIAQKYPEDASQDYIANNSSYTLNNTFSAVRQNILNWYPFREHADILEVGAGMGAVTGLLCDKADSVTAVEMNEMRAEVIRARYCDRKNLSVISENINDWKTEKKFDYVVFIGVLEYAAVFSDAQRPYDEFLTSVKRLLKDDGILLFAIENRFGLKYWLGGSEDHLQKPFAGLAGYDKGTPRTFSRKELEVILERVGFLNHRFYSVLPDYKFPELIFSDEYTPNYMNLRKVSFTYSKNSTLIADEKKLYKDIIENDTFPFFSNSFLVETSAKKLNTRHIIHVSAKGEVYKEFRVSTIMDSEDGVYKVPMHKNAVVHVHNILSNTEYLRERGVAILPVEMKNNVLYSKKYVGISAQDVFAKALTDNDRSLVVRLIEELRRNLLKSTETVESNINNIVVKNNLGRLDIDYGIILQKAFVDMTFYNAFWENERLLFFDQEWCFDRVPLRFCLYYAIKSAYLKAEVDTQITLEELVADIGVCSEEANVYDKLEEFIWSNVLYRQTDFYGEDGYCNRYNEEITLDAQKAYLTRLEDDVRKQNEVIEKNAMTINNQAGHINQLIESERGYLHDIHDKESQIEQLQESERNCLREFQEAKATVLDQKSQIEQLQESERNCLREFQEAKATVLDQKSQIEQLQESEHNYQREIEDARQTIRNKEGHIELLLEVEREYEREKKSRTYKLALKFRRISATILPTNSKRRFFAKVLLKALRHPLLTLKMINPRRIKNCFIILKTEGVESAQEHYRLVKEYETSRAVPLKNESIVIEKVSEEGKSVEKYEKLSFPIFAEPQISIVIPVYNQFEYTYHCLESILRNSGECTYEIIIANDCSTDLTQRLGEVVDGITVINNESNLRFLLNCNNAAKQAKGKFILFLNNDTQVQKNWLKPLLDLIEKDPRIGLVGSKLIYSDGYLQEAGGILWEDASAWNYGNRQNPNDSEFSYVHEADYVSGAAMMIRTDLWKEIGGFDERFIPAYCEDSDLAFEVRKHGYKVVLQPQSVVVHFEGVSNGTDLTSGQKKYQVENQKKFYEKWKAELEVNHFKNGTKVFLARERSRNRKHVLVIDHYVPQYDKDAGSKTTFMYLKMMVQKGYQVTFLGDNFYQHEPYTSELQQMGILVLYGPKYAEHWKEWLEENIQYFDVFYLNRPHISVKYIDFIKERAKGRIIYYGHDLHFLRLKREYELSGEERLIRESKEWLKKELYLMHRADMNYYPSQIEVEEIHKIDPNIPVKAITAYVYDKFENVHYDIGDRNGLLFVGGFGHGPNVDAVLWFIEKIYPQVYKSTGAPFYIVGSNAPKEITDIKMEGVEVKGFVTEEELRKLYRTSRMAVVPLRYGAGVKGKVVEALYYGIPIATTSVGAEGIGGIENIVVVKDSELDLSRSICNLYSDGARLKNMSWKSQKYVRENFGTEAVWSIVEKDFN